MNAPLYTIEILRLAASLGDAKVLERVDGGASERSPTCGSAVVTQVQMGPDQRIEAFSQTVHACAFGQASAALLERHAIGRSLGEIEIATDQLRAWLGGERDNAPDWPDMMELEPVLPRKSRHAAILLPFRALLGAMTEARR